MICSRKFPSINTNNTIEFLNFLNSISKVMNELSEKCILFIANNLEAIVQVPCVLSSISERLLAKLAVCLPVSRLHDLVDKKDKIKSKLFQRKIEFMFDPTKLDSIFDSKKSLILNEWKSSTSTTTSTSSSTDPSYLNYLYEHENDASTLFRCKLCSRHMTKSQCATLACNLAVLDKHGEYIYLHVPDERFELMALLRTLKERLKTWQWVYWFIWCLTKSFRCKKCSSWFRLVDVNKCRLNDYSQCSIHDGVRVAAAAAELTSLSLSCACMFCEHLIDASSASSVYAHCFFVNEACAFESPEMRLNKFVQAQIEAFGRVKDVLLTTPSDLASDVNNGRETSFNLCDLIEGIIHGCWL